MAAVSEGRGVRARDTAAGPAVPRVDHTPLLGTWINFDTRTTGISRVELSDRDGSLFVRVFGAGEPEPIDWGEAPAIAFSEDVRSAEAVAFTAEYDLGFERVSLAGYVNRRLLTVEPGTTFTDGDGRAPYFTRAHLYPQ
jgi:hypothetical protein